MSALGYLFAEYRPAGLVLEDADYNRVKGLFDTFPFGVADRQLVLIADAVVSAT